MITLFEASGLMAAGSSSALNITAPVRSPRGREAISETRVGGESFQRLLVAARGRMEAVVHILLHLVAAVPPPGLWGALLWTTAPFLGVN